MKRRASILLECILAVALFVAAGITLLSLTGTALRAMETSRDRELACDLARSALARIEAGIASPESLSGPARPNRSDDDTRDETGPDSLWELEVETEPAAVAPLTLVHIRAFKRAAPGSDDTIASYTLSQLIRWRVPPAPEPQDDALAAMLDPRDAAGTETEEGQP